MKFPCYEIHFDRKAQHLALVGHGNGRLRHRHALRAATTRDCNNAWTAATRCGKSRRSMQGPCKPNARTCREAMRQRVNAATNGTPVPPKGNKWQYPPRLHVHDTHARPRGQIGIVGSGGIKPGRVRAGLVRSGQVRSGRVGSSQVNSPRVKSVQVSCAYLDTPLSPTPLPSP